MTGITVVDVMREMGVTLDKRATQAVGVTTREAYRGITGRLPPKDLREKTNALGGSHCFAIYPMSFKPVIVAAVDEWSAHATRQGTLF